MNNIDEYLDALHSHIISFPIRSVFDILQFLLIDTSSDCQDNELDYFDLVVIEVSFALLLLYYVSDLILHNITRTRQ